MKQGGKRVLECLLTGGKLLACDNGCSGDDVLHSLSAEAKKDVAQSLLSAALQAGYNALKCQNREWKAVYTP